jgi:hypothetical protein
MLQPHTEEYSSRIAGMDFYKNHLFDSLIVFDDADLIRDSIDRWLGSIGRQVDHVFNPTGREHREIAISIPERYQDLLSVIQECEL